MTTGISTEIRNWKGNTVCFVKVLFFHSFQVVDENQEFLGLGF